MERNVDAVGQEYYRPLPEVDVPLLRKTYEKVLNESQKPFHVEDFWDDKRYELDTETLDQAGEEGKLSTWVQGSWFRELSCGTAGCFAGWSFLLSEGADKITDVGDGFVVGEGDDSEGLHVSNWAQDHLGLTSSEAGELFNGHNTIERITEVVTAILARAGDGL